MMFSGSGSSSSGSKRRRLRTVHLKINRRHDTCGEIDEQQPKQKSRGVEAL